MALFDDIAPRRRAAPLARRASPSPVPLPDVLAAASRNALTALPSRPAPRRRARPGARKALGQILVERGALSPGDLARALALQAREDARFGDILVAQGMVSQSALFAALSEQYGTIVADLVREPPDVRLVDEMGAETCIRLGILPWKRVGGAPLVIASRPEEFERLAPALPGSFGRVHLALAPDEHIQTALVAARTRALARAAEERVAPEESCRDFAASRMRGIALLAGAALALLAVTRPGAAFSLLVVAALLTMIVNTGLRVAAAALHLGRPRPAPEGPAPAKGQRRLPTISILVPLFREREIAGRLVERLARLDYPRECLDICLVVEADDHLTQETLDRADLPRWMRRIVVPRGQVKTKPRAMNFALDFCRGSIVGIYDAEDAPDPDQLHRVARRFADAGPEVACLQGRLDFYNVRTNWLSRCFTIEYAIWFRLILPGLARMGFVVPLGGTTLFMRRGALERLGGWDAHNVTEDAELGVRLARHGYRTELIDTVTREEANCRPWPWIKQRSRWIKGYAMTYAVHMRAPARLRRELGTWKFLGVQALFLGNLGQVLLAPFLWSFWLLPLGVAHPVLDGAPPGVVFALIALFFTTEMINIAIGLIALNQRGRRGLWAWLPTMHLYFPLASIAALKGLVEIAYRPFYWDKTRHGLFDPHPMRARGGRGGRGLFTRSRPPRA